jgi:beta-glucosidase
MSDFGAVHSTAPSLAAGLDLELNRPLFYTPERIEAALDAGTITRAQIDAAAFRVIRAYIKAGLFDHPLPATEAADVSTPAHKATSLAVAERGSVLLKNRGEILPLKSHGTSIAVIGPTASNTPTNGISASTVCGMTASFFPDGQPLVACDPVAPLDAITQRAARSADTVTFDNGQDVAAAAAAARAADVTIVFGYYTMGEGFDRPNLSLDGNGDALISAVAAANPNTVVVLEAGSAVLMPWLDQVKGVVQAWYPGDQQGTAIAALLWGDVNPSGRLPLTFPKTQADLPTRTPGQYPGVFSDGGAIRPPGDRTSIRQVSYTEGLKVGYTWYDSQNLDPLFPFGYGLSYTSFAYDRLRVAPAAVGATRGAVEVRFQIRNTGQRTGTETPPVYLTLPSAAGEPGKRLVGFDQVTLQPGQARQVRVIVSSGSPDHPLSYYDTIAHAWQTAPGTYAVQVGSSSRDLPLQATFQVR